MEKEKKNKKKVSLKKKEIIQKLVKEISSCKFPTLNSLFQAFAISISKFWITKSCYYYYQDLHRRLLQPDSSYDLSVSSSDPTTRLDFETLSEHPDG